MAKKADHEEGNDICQTTISDMGSFSTSIYGSLNDVSYLSDEASKGLERTTSGVNGITQSLNDVTTEKSSTILLDDGTGLFDEKTRAFHVTLTTSQHAITTTSEDPTDTPGGTSTPFNDIVTGFSDTYLDNITPSLDATSTHFDKSTTAAIDANIRNTGNMEIVYITVSVLSMFFNLIALVVFCSARKMRTQLHIKFLISQSVVDAVAGLFLLINTFAIRSMPQNFKGAYDEFLCKYYYSGYPLWVSLVASTYNLVALSIMKYLLVGHPLFFKVHFTSPKVYAMIVLTYFPGIAIFTALYETSTGIKDGQCYTGSLWPREYVRILFGVFTYLINYLIPIVLHIYCYGGILLVLCRKSVSVTSTKERAQRKAIKLVIIVVAVCFLCLSWNMNLILLYYLGIRLDFQGWSYNVSVILLYLNCLVNPIIYVIFYTDYRNQFLYLWCGWYRMRQQERERATELTAVA